MAFVFRNDPSVFERAIIKTLGEPTNSLVIIYKGDMLVTAATSLRG